MVCFLTGLTACRGRADISTAERPFSTDPQDYAVFIEQLSRGGEEIFSLDGFFRVKASREDVTKRAKGVFIFRYPGYVYLEFLSPLGTAKVVAGVDERQIVILYPGEKEYFAGEATSQNLERIFGFPFRPGEMFTIFSGQFIDFKKYGAVSFQKDTLRRAIRGDAVSADGALEASFWMKPDTGWLFTGFLTERAGQQRELRVHYGDFEKLASYPMPTRISIERKASPWRVTFKGKDVRINGIGDTARFTLAPPPGGVLIPLEKLDPENPLFFGEEDDESS
jgi:hypothetical protein